MRLSRYINEQTPPVKKRATELEENMLLELIHKECKQWVKEIGNFSITSVPNPVFRGVEENVRIFRVKRGARRPDRQPKFTQKEVFEIFDKAFADKFGWWARSKGVFTGSEHVAYSYGNPYIFMPMGKYRYVWSARYQEVWHHLTHPSFWEGLTDKEKKKHLVNARIDAKLGVDQYHNRNIRGAVRSAGVAFEAIFECKKYLLIEKSTYIGISNRI